MRFFATIIFLSICFEPFSQNLVVPYQGKDSRWFLVRKTTKEKLKGSYDKVEYINEGVYQVWADSIVGLVDTVGHELLKVEYKQINFVSNYREGLYPLKKDSSIYYFNNKGEIVFQWKGKSPPYMTKYFNSGLLDSPVGVIDKSGSIIIPKNDSIGYLDFQDSIVQSGKNVGKDVYWGMSDRKGNVLIPHIYKYFDLYEDYARGCKDVSGRNAICDIYYLNGQKVFNKSFSWTSFIKVFPKTAVYHYIKDDGSYKHQLKDLKTNKLISDQYDALHQLSNGNVLAKNIKGYYAILGKEGKLVLKMLWFRMLLQGEHFGRIAYNDSLKREAAIKIDGTKLFTLPDSLYFWDFITGAYNDGYIVVNKKTKMNGFLNANGEILIEPVYYRLFYIPDLKIWKVMNKDLSEYYIDDRGNKYAE